MSHAVLSALGGLFLAAFGAATVLPFQSELVFGAMVVRETASLWVLIAVASVGNTLGSVVNYFMGLFVERWVESRWFPASRRQMERAQHWYAKYGVWTLLLSWAPFGDAFTVVAGMMRANFWLFLALVALAKTGRFIVLGWALA